MDAEEIIKNDKKIYTYEEILLYKNKKICLNTNLLSLDKLLSIEKINNFINAFSEENKNLISRQKIEEDTIEKYLKNSRKDENASPLDFKFNEFCEAYNEITNVPPYNMNKDQPVKTILNDEKVKTPLPFFLSFFH